MLWLYCKEDLIDVVVRLIQSLTYWKPGELNKVWSPENYFKVTAFKIDLEMTMQLCTSYTLNKAQDHLYPIRVSQQKKFNGVKAYSSGMFSETTV